MTPGQSAVVDFVARCHLLCLFFSVVFSDGFYATWIGVTRDLGRRCCGHDVCVSAGAFCILYIVVVMAGNATSTRKKGTLCPLAYSYHAAKYVMDCRHSI